MTVSEAIKILKDGRENLYRALDKSVPYEQQHTLVALDMAIKSLEADRKIEKILYDIRNEITMLFIFVREPVIEIIDKHLAEVRE